VTLGSNFSYLKTHRKTTDAATSNMVVDKPKYMTNAFMIISPVRQWRIIPSIQVVGARYNLDHEKLLPSFVRVDLKTAYDITENISVQAGVENIGDVNYGYSGSTAAYGRDTQPGRNYFMGMSYIY
jgi:outer membrane receptor protein involved in Fe transport